VLEQKANFSKHDVALKFSVPTPPLQISLQTKRSSKSNAKAPVKIELSTGDPEMYFNRIDNNYPFDNTDHYKHTILRFGWSAKKESTVVKAAKVFIEDFKPRRSTEQNLNEELMLLMVFTHILFPKNPSAPPNIFSKYDTMILEDTLHNAVEIMNLKENHRVDIVDHIGFPGVCRHFAILYKALADQLGYSCRLFLTRTHTYLVCLGSNGQILVDANNGRIFQLQKDDGNLKLANTLFDMISMTMETVSSILSLWKSNALSRLDLFEAADLMTTSDSVWPKTYPEMKDDEEEQLRFDRQELQKLRDEDLAEFQKSEAVIFEEEKRINRLKSEAEENMKQKCESFEKGKLAYITMLKALGAEIKLCSERGILHARRNPEEAEKAVKRVADIMAELEDLETELEDLNQNAKTMKNDACVAQFKGLGQFAFKMKICWVVDSVKEIAWPSIGLFLKNDFQ